MFFQISPARTCPVKNSSSDQPVVENNEAVLILAPFTPNPKLCFENCLVGTTSVQTLLIQNPTKNDIELVIGRNLPEELGVELSWNRATVKKSSETLLILTWLPKSTGSSRHIFTIEDGCRLKRDIPVIFKSILPKKSRKKSIKPTYLVKKVKSPISKKMNPPNIRPPLPNITNLPKITVSSPYSTSFGKENAPTFIFNQNESTYLVQNRRETYILSTNNELPPTISNNEEFDDSLESKQPDEAVNVNHSIDLKLQSSSFSFTPQNIKFQFNPNECSTGEKSQEDSTFHFGKHRKRISLFDNENATFELPVPNTSTETFVINKSTETYVIGDAGYNISSSTFTRDSSIGNVASLQISPVAMRVEQPSHLRQFNARSVIEANLWADDYHNHQQTIPLVSIQEESPRERSSMFLKRKSELTIHITPPKRANLTANPTKWARQGGVAASRIAKRSLGLNLRSHSSAVETSTTITKEMILKDPFLLAASDNLDPFMTSSLYFNEQWIIEQEVGFKKWLNALLTPHEALEANVESHPVDVARLWRECKRKTIELAPTKEQVCDKIHVSSRLDSLRRSAMVLYRSRDMSAVLLKICQNVDAGRLSIRKDRDVHLDLGLQSEIMSILLSYNPLWLRIGLETVYNEKLTLKSNSDIIGMCTFLSERFFKHPVLLKKFKTVHNPKYSVELKRFLLKRFLSLIYFLDRAKETKMIAHDPCLFCKNAPMKESRDALLRLTRETLSAVGDITKYLKLLGYVVSHKQTYINEFDYAVNSLGVDLRDGVRLTRVMEIILLRNDLTNKLRAPAISRLQKIHNMKIVFDALAGADFHIDNAIIPKDIVDGHKEKTLSFLWQIIHKFEAPYLIERAKTIQKWWRSAAVMTKRSHLQQRRAVLISAAVTIQNWYRKHLLRRKIEKWAVIARDHIEQNRRHEAAVKIQSFVRMHLIRAEFRRMRHAIVTIQRVGKKWLTSANYRRRVASAIKIQSIARMYLARKRLKTLKYTVLYVEERYASLKLMREARNRYDTVRSSAILIQRWFRACIEMRRNLHEFKSLKIAAITIQIRYRALIAMRREKLRFVAMKASVLLIERWYLASKMMQTERIRFLTVKCAAITIQTQFRANKSMKSQHGSYSRLKWAALVIQRRWKARKARDLERNRFLVIKKASIYIQTHYRIKKISRKVRDDFLDYRMHVIKIQQRFRAKLSTRQQLLKYHMIKKSALVIQRRYRAHKSMMNDRQQYEVTRQSVIAIQRWYRRLIMCRLDRDYFLRLKESTICIQQKYRALKLMISCQNDYSNKKSAAIIIQKYFRSFLKMKEERHSYETLKNASKVIQRRYRANKLMRLQYKSYNRVKVAALVIQRRWRAGKARDLERNRFLALKKVSIYIQTHYRNRKISRRVRHDFLVYRMHVIKIQQRFKAKLSMRRQLTKYHMIKKSVLAIQQRYRAHKLMMNDRQRYEITRQSVIVIQRWYRRLILCRSDREYFLRLKESTICIQQNYRALKLMISYQNDYSKKKSAAIIIQKYFRSFLKMREERHSYETLKNASKVIQRRYRANKLMRLQYESYNRVKMAALVIQRRWKAGKARDLERNRFLALKKVSIYIQTHYRNGKISRRVRHDFLDYRMHVIKIQQRFRATISMRQQHTKYHMMKKSVLAIQRRYRAHKSMVNDRQRYEHARRSAVVIQRWYRRQTLYKNDRCDFLQLKHSAICIQRNYRSWKMMMTCKIEYSKTRSAATKIQRFFRGFLKMKRDRRIYVLKLETIIRIQSISRGFLVRREYGDFTSEKARNERRLKKKQAMFATRIQAAWRGYKSRSVDEPQLKEIRDKLGEANVNAEPQKTLRYRCHKAIQLLASDTSGIVEIIDALEDIEFVTRRCKTTCLRLSKLVSEQLYITVICSSRSLPEMKVCTKATEILINFCKYPPARAISWQSQHVEKIMMVMVHWCDKEAPLFPTLCTLLWVFAHVAEYKAEMLALPKFDQILDKINVLIERKKKMVSKTRITGLSLFNKANHTPIKPSLKPDWGLEYVKEARLFNNSIDAFNCLVDILMK